jgi:RHS repeat-associated protein
VGNAPCAFYAFTLRQNRAKGWGNLQSGYFWHKDWLGSARLSSSVKNRTVSFDRAFAPFGEMYNNFGNTGGLNFTGDTQDSFTGLFDTPGREYSPIQGRWMSPDPAGPASVNFANPQTFNRYAYALNNPLKLVDPSGLCDESEDPESDAAHHGPRAADDCGGGGGGGGDQGGGPPPDPNPPPPPDPNPPDPNPPDPNPPSDPPPPTDPNNPPDPSNPTDPNNPDNPDDPGNPNNPSDPSAPQDQGCQDAGSSGSMSGLGSSDGSGAAFRFYQYGAFGNYRAHPEGDPGGGQSSSSSSNGQQNGCGNQQQQQQLEDVENAMQQQVRPGGAMFNWGVSQALSGGPPSYWDCVGNGAAVGAVSGAAAGAAVTPITEGVSIPLAALGGAAGGGAKSIFTCL